MKLPYSSSHNTYKKILKTIILASNSSQLSSFPSSDEFMIIYITLCERESDDE